MNAVSQRIYLAAAIFLWSLAGQANVFYPDDRVVDSAPAAPWSYLGKLTRSGSSKYCTAALVGSRRTVWTAAHCIWDYSRGAVHAERFYFEPSDRSKPVAVAHFRLGTTSSHDIYFANRDWAVLVLESDVPANGYFAVSSSPVAIEVGHPLWMGAYGEDRATGRFLTTQSSCQLTGALRRRGMLTHDCDSWHGSSGAPIVTRFGDDYYVIMLNTSQLGGSLRLSAYAPRYANVGIPISDELIEVTKANLGARCPVLGKGMDPTKTKAPLVYHLRRRNTFFFYYCLFFFFTFYFGPFLPGFPGE